MTNETILRNLTLPETACNAPKTGDLHMQDGHIVQWETLRPCGNVREIDCSGLLILPGLVDAHIHLDKTMWGGHYSAGSLPPAPVLSDLIENERMLRKEGRIDPSVSAPRLLEQMIAMGTTALRSHIDIDPTARLKGVETLMEVREAFRDRIDIEFAAFPQSGILSSPSASQMMEDALKMGVETVGGLDPAGFDGDPAKHLDIVFGLAERYGKKIDIHLHEADALGAFTIRLIAERTKAHGMRGRVAISHAFALGDAEGDAFRSLLELLAENGIAVITSAPGDRKFAPRTPLLDAGVNYALGSDNIRDAWSPLGNGDMLDRIKILSLRQKTRKTEQVEEALQMATREGARLLGLEHYGLRAGGRADFLLVPACSITDAVARCPGERIVFKRGEIVAGEHFLETKR